MQNYPIIAMLSTNAGLILEYRGTKILLDCIYGPREHPFSNLGIREKQLLFSGQTPYDNVDYLLFTHQHPDHFSPTMVREYLEAEAENEHKSKTKKIIFPLTASQSQQRLISTIRDRNLSFHGLTPSCDNVEIKLTEGITVRPLWTRHLDKKYWDTPHCCYLISFDNRHVLFTADVDYTAETFDRISQLPLKASFVNPLFFKALSNGKFFKGTLDTESIFIYHIPFTDDDQFGMRASLFRDLDAWPENNSEAYPLCSPFEQIVL